MTEQAQYYARLRKNILQRQKRIVVAGLPTYKVELPRASELDSKQLKTAIKRAERLNPKITIDVARERREKRLAQRRERYAEKKREELELTDKERYFLAGARKWLKRSGLSTRLINKDNIKDFIEYYNYRKSIAGEKNKYEFDKFIQDFAERMKATGASASEVLYDFKSYLDEKAELIAEFHGLSPARPGYSAVQYGQEYFNQNVWYGTEAQKKLFGMPKKGQKK